VLRLPKNFFSTYKQGVKTVYCYYYDLDNNRVSVESKEELKELVMRGVIHEDSIIETNTGQKASAKKLKWLEFKNRHQDNYEDAIANALAETEGSESSGATYRLEGVGIESLSDVVVPPVIAIPPRRDSRTGKKETTVKFKVLVILCTVLKCFSFLIIGVGIILFLVGSYSYLINFSNSAEAAENNKANNSTIDDRINRYRELNRRAEEIREAALTPLQKYEKRMKELEEIQNAPQRMQEDIQDLEKELKRLEAEKTKAEKRMSREVATLLAMSTITSALFLISGGVFLWLIIEVILVIISIEENVRYQTTLLEDLSI
jgi:hypothetical protein